MNQKPINDQIKFYAGIGASAGGLNVIKQILSAIEVTDNLCLFVIQHLSPDHKSLMSELISKVTSFEVQEATNKIVPKAGFVYLIPPGFHMRISQKRIILEKGKENHHITHPIDTFFYSLAQEHRDRSIAIILTGTGSDGAKGIATIKHQGGLVIVQDPKTAEFDGMPNAAIKSGFFDLVLPPDEIAKKINRFAVNPLQNESFNQQTYHQIIDRVSIASQINFHHYKENSLKRRIDKRIGLLHESSPENYLKRLKKSTEEANTLARDFLIGVTEFFRDKDVFRQIENSVIPSLAEAKDISKDIRIWIPGCSTGEEVYSFAILLDQYLLKHNKKHNFKIFATDIDQEAINFASKGSYPLNIESDLKDFDCTDYLVNSGNYINISKRIREKIVFTKHNLLEDPPFIQMDIISCRNLFIYFKNDVQQRILSNMLFALNKYGYLILGLSENLGGFENKFHAIDHQLRIYQLVSDYKKPVIQPGRKMISLDSGTRTTTPSLTQENPRHETGPFREYLLNRFTPPTFFVNEDLKLVYIQNDLSPYIKLNSGTLKPSVTHIFDNKLAWCIKKGIDAARESSEKIQITESNFMNNSKAFTVDLNIEKCNGTQFSEPLYMVSIIEKDVRAQHSMRKEYFNSEIDPESQKIAELEDELEQTRDQLQHFILQLETSREELQSTNEELMVSNEEMLSSNEELQSVNEELYTVNSEIQDKNHELENLNSDLENLISNINISIIFLDRKLKIRKFTPSITKHFKIKTEDIGRPLSIFSSHFSEKSMNDLLRECSDVLKNNHIVEHEIVDDQHTHFLMRISPFFKGKRNEGIVLTFDDITHIREIEKDLFESEEKFKSVMDYSNIGIAIINKEGIPILVNEATEKFLGQHKEDIKKKRFSEYTHPDFLQTDNYNYRKIWAGEIKHYSIEKKFIHNSGKEIWAIQSISALHNNQKQIRYAMAMILDVTSRISMENELIKAMYKAEESDRLKSAFLANMSHEIRTPMNAIIGFSQLLQENTIHESDRDKCLETIVSQGNHLLSLINDIIDISKIESGILNVKEIECHLPQLVNMCVESFKVMNGKNIEYQIFPDDKFNSPYILIDENRLTQVLNNLLSNATKFTMEGKIEVGYYISGDKYIEFTIKDTGIGIEPKLLDKIFDRFYRVDQDERINTIKGTGLGLAITKALIEKMGGRIWVSSKPGSGSDFRFTIPFKPVAQNNKKPVESNKTESLKFDNVSIMIVEDEDTNYHLLEKILTPYNAKITRAKNGREAVDFIKKRNHTDLILMDIALPKMNGMDATKNIKSFSPDIRIIAQTACVMEGDKENCLKAGCDDFISKPIRKEELLSKISMLLTSKPV